jgi:hypothetical protein
MYHGLFHATTGPSFFESRLQSLRTSNLDEKSTIIADLYHEKANIHTLLRHLPPQVRLFSPLIKPLAAAKDVSGPLQKWKSDLEGIFKSGDVLKSVETGKSLSEIYYNVFRTVKDYECIDDCDSSWFQVHHINARYQTVWGWGRCRYGYRSLRRFSSQGLKL